MISADVRSALPMMEYDPMFDDMAAAITPSMAITNKIGPMAKPESEGRRDIGKLLAISAPYSNESIKNRLLLLNWAIKG